MSSETRSERDYLYNEINPVVEPLMIMLLTERPAEPIPYIVDYLSKLAQKKEPEDNSQVFIKVAIG